ncbi:MAG TPA: glutamine synthetase family protein [Burkholderiales bacterium]|jgi:glutamine synthetase
MAGFIEKHSLWSDEQKKLAADIAGRIRSANLRLIRLAWADPHGASRAKAVTVPVFLEVLKTGYNINVATTTLDSAGGRVFASFTRGGGMGLDEMTGSPNLTIVPDLATFRVLPWAPGVGWVLCDEYFNSGVPFHFSPRQLLKKLLRDLQGKGYGLRIGLEVEWYLARVAEEALNDEHVGVPGLRGRPIRTTPAEPGYSYHSETNMDLMQPVFGALAETCEALGLPLRSIENEWGPGQVECTFSAQDALRAADDLLLFRTATRQLCRRLGYFATFMARPALKGYYASGWHLHQSLVDVKTGENRFMPASGREPLSDLGKHYLGGLLANAVPATVFATPTVNGYRRFKPNSLAPDRAGWAYDHRGTMVRALGGAGDPATRLENRLGEPAANPYLFIASQIVSGLDGIKRKLDPGPQDEDAYSANRAMLPTRLTGALEALNHDTLFRKQLGDTFVDYYLKLKGNEAKRFAQFLEENRMEGMPEEPTAWEQNEYFDFF